MPTTIAPKYEFKAPVQKVTTTKAVKAIALQAAPLVGTWTNCDHATRGIVKIVIGATGSGVSVQAYGNCTPTPCDWGVVPGVVDAADVSSKTAVAFKADYKFAFAEIVLTGVLDRGALIAETFTRFTDTSGRSNYYAKEYFVKA